MQPPFRLVCLHLQTHLAYALRDDLRHVAAVTAATVVDRLGIVAPVLAARLCLDRRSANRAQHGFEIALLVHVQFPSLLALRCFLDEDANRFAQRQDRPMSRSEIVDADLGLFVDEEDDPSRVLDFDRSPACCRASCLHSFCPSRIVGIDMRYS